MTQRRSKDGGGHGSDFANIFQDFINQGDGHPPLEHAPCANVQPEIDWSCKNTGRLACGKCQLVGYCSKVSDNEITESFTSEYVWVLHRNVRQSTGGGTNQACNALDLLESP